MISATKKISIQHLCFSLVLLVAAFRPYPRAVFNTPLFDRLSDLFLLFIVIALSSSIIYSRDFRLEISIPSLSSLIILVLILVLSSISILASPVLSAGDPLEIFRFIMYVSLFVLGILLTWKPNQIYSYIIFPLIIITVVQILLSFGHFFDIKMAREILMWYTSEKHLAQPRSIGTFYNPYILGIFLILPFSYSFHILISYKNKPTHIIAYAILICMIGISMLTTQSRSVIVVLAGTIIYMIILIYIVSDSYSVLNSVGFFMMMLIVSYILISFTDLQYLTNGISAIVNNNIENITSARTRIKRYSRVVDLVIQRPIIGWGPAKTVIPNIENDYLLYVFRYGFLGLLLFLALILKFMGETFNTYTQLRNSNLRQTTSFQFAFHTWLVALAAGGMVNSFMSNPRIYPFIFLLLGVSYSLTNSVSTEDCQ